MNVIRQAMRGINRLLTEGGGAIYRDGEPVFRALASERALLQSMSASGGANRRRNIPVIITGVTSIRTSALRRNPATHREIPAAETRRRELVTPPRRSLLQTRRLRRAATDTPPSSQLYNFAHLNARSLIPRLDEVNILLEQEDVDILCISETWLGPNVSNRVLVFPGYSIARCDRAVQRGARNKRGGGVAILTREGLRSTTLDFGGAHPAVESLWLSVTGPGRRTVTVGAIYRPPNSPIAKGLELIEEQLQTAAVTNKPVVVMGDFNIDQLNDTKPGTLAFKRIISGLSLTQLVDMPTHIHPTPTLLDLVLTNATDQHTSIKVLSEAVADHQPVIFSAQICRQRLPRPSPITTRPWRRLNWDALRLRLLTADWESLYIAVGVDEKLTAFMNVWNSAIDELCPTITVSRRRPDCPWLRDDPDLATAIEERDAARRTWERSGSPEARRQYQLRRNNVKGHLIRAKRRYLCEGLLTDRRGFWSRIKRFALQPAGAIPSASASDDVAARADDFNKYFASVGERVAADVAQAGCAGAGPRPPRVCAATLELRPVTLPELSKAIGSMSSSRAAGVDEVPLHAIVNCFPVIGPHLLHLINRSIVTAVFPEAWKLARVIPIHKSGDQSDPSNFRPISILSVLSKILEKVVAIQLMSYLTQNNILSPHQYAYRPSHSTEHAMLDAVDWIEKHVDDGHVVSLASIDLSKAFDSVNHALLLNKLEWYGVSSAWFASYLYNRRQVVTGGGSDPLHVSHGVAQGSILGPILFLLVTNDISSFLTHGRLLSYADDTQILDHSPPTAVGLSSLKARVEKSLSELQTWFQQNSLKMNPRKTSFTLIGTKQTLAKTPGFEITSGLTIQPSKTVKILGVLLDQQLTWQSHIDAVVRRCNAITISLFKVRHHLTPEVRKLLVETHVLPHIHYCLSVWGGAAQCHLHRVQKSLNLAARMVSGVRRSEHISPTLAALGWHGVNDMVRTHDCALVARAVNGTCPPAITAMFTPRAEVSLRNTRAIAAGTLDLPGAD